jgi:hypothetical protein
LPERPGLPEVRLRAVYRIQPATLRTLPERPGLLEARLRAVYRIQPATLRTLLERPGLLEARLRAVYRIQPATLRTLPERPGLPEARLQAAQQILRSRPLAYQVLVPEHRARQTIPRRSEVEQVREPRVRAAAKVAEHRRSKRRQHIPLIPLTTQHTKL